MLTLNNTWGKFYSVLRVEAENLKRLIAGDAEHLQSQQAKEKDALSIAAHHNKPVMAEPSESKPIQGVPTLPKG